MRLVLFTIFGLFTFLISPFTQFAYAQDSKLISEEKGTFDIDAADVRYYELVPRRYQPEEDEYYLDSIFSRGTNTFARISRAKGVRASELHKNGANYKVGDYINQGLVIKDIDTNKRFVLVYDEVKKSYYRLKMSYGKAISRLTPVKI